MAFKLLKNLGAKQVAHRLLSAGPFFVLALMSVVATPSAEGNRDLFWSVNQYFRDGWRAVSGVGIVLIYFGLWWWTSIPESVPNPRRDLQVRLRSFQSEFLQLRNCLFRCEDDAAFDQQTEKADILLNEMKVWVDAQMSTETWMRLSRQKAIALHYTFAGKDFAADKADARDGVINGVDGYIEAIDDLIKNDGWDK